MASSQDKPLCPTEQSLIASGFTRKDSPDHEDKLKERAKKTAKETQPHEENVPEHAQCQCTCGCSQRRRYRSNAWLDEESRGRVTTFTAPYEFCKTCMDNYHLDSVRDTPSWDCHPDQAVKDVDFAPDAYCQTLGGEFHARCGLRPRRFNESQGSEEGYVEGEDSPWEDAGTVRDNDSKHDDAIVHESEVLEHE